MQFGRDRLPWVVDGMLAILLAAVVLLPGRGAGPASGAGSGLSTEASDASVWARKNQYLEHRIELASKPGFYLILDVPRLRLVLLNGDSLLEEYPLERVELGVPRIRGLRSAPAGWQTRIWTGGTLLPARVASEAMERSLGTEGPGEIPPLPEDAFPAPRDWRLRLETGLEVEIVAAAEPKDSRASGIRLGALLRDVRDGLRQRPPVRIRIVMAGDQAGTLYRALPDDVALLLHLDAGSTEEARPRQATAN